MLFQQKITLLFIILSLSEAIGNARATTCMENWEVIVIRADTSNPRPCQLLLSEQNPYARISCLRPSFANLYATLQRYGEDALCTKPLELIIDNGDQAWRAAEMVTFFDQNDYPVNLVDVSDYLFASVKGKLARLLLRNFENSSRAELHSGALSSLKTLQVLKMEKLFASKVPTDWLPNSTTLESVIFENVTITDLSLDFVRKMTTTSACVFVKNLIVPCTCEYARWLPGFLRTNYTQMKPLVIFPGFLQGMQETVSPFDASERMCGFYQPAGQKCFLPNVPSLMTNSNGPVTFLDLIRACELIQNGGFVTTNLPTTPGSTSVTRSTTKPSILDTTGNFWNDGYVCNDGNLTVSQGSLPSYTQVAEQCRLPANSNTVLCTAFTRICSSASRTVLSSAFWIAALLWVFSVSKYSIVLI